MKLRRKLGDGKRRPENRLVIRCPSSSTGVGDILLNGKRLEGLLSLRLDIPGDKDRSFIKVTAEFLSSVDIEGNMRAIKVRGRRVEFT